MAFEEDLFDIGNGIRSGFQDAPGFFENVLDGVGDLGVTVGKVSARYAGTAGTLANSPILAAAQQVIDAERATTGSGDPEDGNAYRESAARLGEIVGTLTDADPHDDEWDGRAATKYEEANDAHRSVVSRVQNADREIGMVLALEADQVSKTRQTLDTTSQHLHDYGLATAVTSFLPGANAAKLAADAAAASAALATSNAALATLVKNSVENSVRIRHWLADYTSTTATTVRSERHE